MNRKQAGILTLCIILFIIVPLFVYLFNVAYNIWEQYPKTTDEPINIITEKPDDHDTKTEPLVISKEEFKNRSGVVQVENQIWMSENLSLPIAGSVFHPDIDTKRDSIKYGRLYTFDSAIQACPKGWHLPTLKEWIILANVIGGYFDPENGMDIGNPNKSYNELTKSGVNKLGFTLGALAHNDGSFSNILNKQGFYWTSTKDSDGTAHMFRFREDFKQLSTYSISTDAYLSCRCIKDNMLNEQIPADFLEEKNKTPKTEIVYFADNYGNRIKSLKIGEQIWTAENINKESKYSVCYQNNPENCKKYGRLYNWYEASKICPDGWHLPSDKEWQILISSFGGYYDVSTSESIGTPKKAFKNLTKNGDSNFNALLGGSGTSQGTFNNLNHTASFWSSTKRSNSEVWFYYFYARDQNKVSRHDFVPNAYFSCRCVKDSDK